MYKAIATLVAGILIVLVSLTADTIGIGEGTGYGWKQITGTVVGLVIVAAGVILFRSSRTS
jgi:hypothetical protein